jgi:pimeloyl-ACP methyl ester carboxylesterase
MTAFLLRAFGVLLMLTALALTLSRAPDRPVETLVARWALPPSDFVEVKGQVVHIRDEGPRGDPLPVVLMHGTSASLHTWEGWVKALKGQRRVISFDLPGFGLTGPFSGQYAAADHPADYSGDAYARFVIDLLDQLQVQRFVAAGNSFGGEVAWRLAGLAPARVERLILVDSSGLAPDPAAVPLGWYVARVPALRWLLEELLPRSLVAQGIEGVYGHPERVTPELVDRYFELALRQGNRRALGQRLRQAHPGADIERLKTLTLPTLILWGGKDRLFPAAVARRFHADIAGSRLVIFDDLGHVPQEEDPARTVLAVREFLGLK